MSNSENFWKCVIFFIEKNGELFSPSVALFPDCMNLQKKSARTGKISNIIVKWNDCLESNSSVTMLTVHWWSFHNCVRERFNMVDEMQGTHTIATQGRKSTPQDLQETLIIQPSNSFTLVIRICFPVECSYWKKAQTKTPITFSGIHFLLLLSLKGLICWCMLSTWTHAEFEETKWDKQCMKTGFNEL